MSSPAITAAASINSLAKLESLLSTDQHPNHQWAALMEAVDLGFYHAAEIILKAGTSPDEGCAIGGETVLMRSCFKRYPDIPRLLLEYGADPHRIRQGGLTALMDAAAHNVPAAVADLLAYGAQVSVVDEDGHAAMQYAVSNHSASCLGLLIDAGAELIGKDGDVYAESFRSMNCGEIAEIIDEATSRRNAAALIEQTPQPNGWKNASRL